MKKSDIAMIILIAAVSVGVASLVIGSIPGLSLPADTVEKVKTIKRYDSAVGEPDPAVFNGAAINPTVDITIGDTTKSAN